MAEGTNTGRQTPDELMQSLDDPRVLLRLARQIDHDGDKRFGADEIRTAMGELARALAPPKAGEETWSPADILGTFQEQGLSIHHRLIDPAARRVTLDDVAGSDPAARQAVEQAMQALDGYAFESMNVPGARARGTPNAR